MKFKRSRSSRRGRIEIIPMIDVMFFLLATFMIASLSMQKLNSVGIKLPQGQATESKLEKLITVTVQKDGQMQVNKAPVPAEGLEAALHALLHGEERVVIAADKDARHGDVVRAMVAARAAGASDFAIAVDAGR